MDTNENKGLSPFQQGHSSWSSAWLRQQCFQNGYSTETIFLPLPLWGHLFSCLSGWGRLCSIRCQRGNNHFISISTRLKKRKQSFCHINV